MDDFLIPRLSIGACDDTLCVRASRFWDFCDHNDEAKLLHSDLVLIDEEGNSIHAQIYPPAHERFKTLVKEGGVYNFSCFKVKTSHNYKPVANNVMLSFSKWTTIEELVEIPPGFPTITYSLTPIEQVRARLDKNEYFTDVIGIVAAVSDVMTLRGRGGQSERLKRVVTICGQSNDSIDVVLWGECASSFPAEQLHKDGQTSPQVVIFVGTLIRSFSGIISITGGASCRWYINPQVPEADPLIASTTSMCQAIKWSQQIASPGPASAAEHKKISDIKFLNPFKTKKTEFLVTVMVKKINSSSWWYNSCFKCARTVKPHGNLYKCTDSGCGHIGSPAPRYKLSIVAGDETGDTNFIVFGKWAQRMIKKQVDTLIASNPRDFLPNDITRLLEKVYTWNVSFTENSKDSVEECFQVNALVEEVKDRSVLPATPAGSQSSSLMLSQDVGGSVQSTPQKSVALPLTTSLPGTSETSYASCATPTKRTLNIPEQPVTPQSARGTALNETTPGKIAGLTRPEPINAPLALAKSPGTPHHGDGTDTLKIVDDQLNLSASEASAPKTRKSTTSKRSRSSPTKRTAKKLFRDEDATGDGDNDSCADVATQPSSTDDM